MYHSFDVEVAKIFADANIATLFENLCFWIAHNKANGKNRHPVTINGEETERTFTFNSCSAFMQLFPYWSRRQIEGYLGKLREKGFIHKENFNRLGFDRTNWYCLVDEQRWLAGRLEENKGKEFVPVVSDSSPEVDGKKSTTPPEISNSSIPRNGGIDTTKPWNRVHDSVESISPNRELDSTEQGNASHGNVGAIPDTNPAVNEDTNAPAAAELKKNFIGLDPELIFDEAFYAAAVVFLEKNRLDSGYLKWLYEKVIKKRPQNLRGYYYSIFLKQDFADCYRLEKANKKTAVTRVVYTCPVCSQTFTSLEYCPQCELRVSDFRDTEKVEKHKKIYALPEDIRSAYTAELAQSILEAVKTGNPAGVASLIDEKYGLKVKE